jgi:hypothetical protein
MLIFNDDSSVVLQDWSSLPKPWVHFRSGMRHNLVTKSIQLNCLSVAGSCHALVFLRRWPGAGLIRSRRVVKDLERGCQA